MCDQGWTIKLKNNPVQFTGKPRLTHSTSKGGTTFSFEVYGRLLPWSTMERARLEASFAGESLFIGNVISQSTDWNTQITTYNALGYYTHTKREPVTKKYKNTFQAIIAELLIDSKAKDFIREVVYKAGNSPDSATEIKNTFLDRQYIGQYLDNCLDDLCKAVGCQWFIDPITGFLVIWQASKITQVREIDVEKARKSECLEFKFNELKSNFIQAEISRVVVAKDADSIRFANVPQSDSVNSYLILSGDPAQSTDLLKKTGIVKSYFIDPDPVNCDFLELDPYSSSYDHTAQSGTFDVIVNDNCGWFAQTEQDWIDITLGVGEGNGPVEFDISANPFTISRSGSIGVSTTGASATHDIFQDGDPEGIPVGCDAVFFTVTEIEDDGQADNLLYIDPPRPKRIIGSAYLTPLVSPGIHTNGTEGSYTANYTLELDLTDSSLSGLSSLKLRYSVQAYGRSNGDTSTSPAGPYASPSYDTTATLTIGSIETITSHVDYAGGEIAGGPFNQTEIKTSGPFGPLFDIDITDQIGSILEINYFLDTNLIPPANGYSPGVQATAYASQAIIDLTVICVN